MKKYYSGSILILLLYSCTTSTNENKSNRPNEWLGSWKAEWQTPPESPSYAGITDMEFYMDGRFVFTEDSLTVQNNGYPGCIFAVDTLRHTQLWGISNDTLLTFNQPQSRGMTYRIVSKTESRIELQLMEDIFITLTK